MSRLFRLSILFLCILFLQSCSDIALTDKIDPAGGLSRKDYLALRERGEPKEEEKEGDALLEEIAPEDLLIPALPAPSLLPPALPTKEEKLVSLSVTDDVPLREVLMDLAREGQVNLELDPRIQGGVIFSAHEQPFDEVLKRLCALAGLRVRDDGAFVRVELDEPYQKSYAVDYLSLSRRTTSEISISTNVFDADVGNTGGKNGSGSNENNSSSKIAGVSDADFWADLEKSLNQVVASTGRHKPLASGGAKDTNASGPSFSIDKQAGMVTVYGTDQQHQAVEKYLTKLKTKTSAQVLIEARIVEVELSDGFQSGINWRSLLSGGINAAASFGTVGAAAPFTSAAGVTEGLFTASLDKSDFAGILSLVRTFGATRILSSPRLTVLNNQTAVMKVARNEVYFVTSAQFPTTVSTAGVPVSGTPVFSSTPHTVPVGLVMTVQPAIDKDKGRITMTLRPTISRVVDRVEDPSIGLNAAQSGNATSASSKIPVLAVREMDSVLQLNSGEVIVMGGLMQDSSQNTDKGVPPFDALPVIGNLAKSRDNQGATSELVILLRATILDNPKPDLADGDLYTRYNRDPRPLLTQP